MAFPATFDEFAEKHKIVDSEEIYTNGTELIPIFRVKQWLEHQEMLKGANCILNRKINKNAISQLKDLINDRRSFLTGDDSDAVFKHDIEALEVAIAAMQGKSETDESTTIAKAANYLIVNLPEIVNKAIEQLPQAIAKAAMMIENRQEQGGAESLNREVYNRLQDIIKLYPYPLGGKNFEEWDGSGD